MISYLLLFFLEKKIKDTPISGVVMADLISKSSTQKSSSSNQKEEKIGTNKRPPWGSNPRPQG